MAGGGPLAAAAAAAAEFQVDDFVAPRVGAEEPSPLTWRDNKEASLSDWTLVIAQQNAAEAV